MDAAPAMEHGEEVNHSANREHKRRNSEAPEESRNLSELSDSEPPRKKLKLEGENVDLKECKNASRQDDIKVETKEEDLEEIKILFLDVDGVLNASGTPGFDLLEEAFMLRLGNIFQVTGCKIVLSSMWRLDEQLKETLFQEMSYIGIPMSLDMEEEPNVYMGDTLDYVGCSEDCRFAGERSEEIIDTLYQIRDSYNVTHWAAVDDMKLGTDMKLQVIHGFEDHFCHTDEAKGLTEENMDRIIAILSD